MSTYKYLDDNGLIYYHSKVKTLLNNKVDKVNGKGLSTNDYTTTEKNKLEGIAAGAEVNQNAFSNVKLGTSPLVLSATSKTDTFTIAGGTGIQLSGDTANKKVTISCDAEVPTKTSDLTNDSGFVTNTDYATGSTGGVVKVESSYALQMNSNGTFYANNLTYTNYGSATNLAFVSKGTLENVITGKNLETANNKVTSMTSSSTNTQYPSAKCVYDAINDAISGVTGVQFEIVQTLPQTGSTGTIYLVSNSGTAPNVYDEYIWLTSSSSYEKIGSTNVDLSGYVQATDMVTITNAEIDVIVA